LFGDNGILGKALGAIPTPDPAFLHSMVTGDPGGAEYFPLNAVRWMTPPRDIAALVTQSQRNLFEAELFHFGEEQRPMSAELYLLGPGRYRLKLVVGENRLSKPFEEYDFNVRKRRTRVTFTLPPRQLCALLIQRR
jgi:hypothetical protein